MKQKYFLGAQNDALYITTGKAPAANNDYPDHEADREVVAKVYDLATGGQLLQKLNSHAALVTALECAKMAMEDDPDCTIQYDIVCDALLLAKGE